ncbi:hypothetical protein [Fibrella arboris]|uniref:hypothetical protein n=1 Tax=Fibrella arboris TaxID=3242486 RepID=UPI00352091A9
MRSLIEKLGKLFVAIEQEQDEEFVLFAFVLPEEAIAWDLLAAAKWIDKDKQAALRYIAEKVQSSLTEQELRDVSGVLLFNTNDFEDETTTIRSETGWVENETEFYGRKIQKGYLFAGPVSDFQVFVNRN